MLNRQDFQGFLKLGKFRGCRIVIVLSLNQSGLNFTISMIYIRDTKSSQIKHITILFLVIFLTNYSTIFSQCTAIGSLPPNTGYYPPDTAIPCIT